MTKLNLTTKRFVIRKSLIGKNAVINFTNKKQEIDYYAHDEVTNTNKEKVDQRNGNKTYKRYNN